MRYGQIGDDVRNLEAPGQVISPPETVVWRDTDSLILPSQIEDIKLCSVSEVDNDIGAKILECLIGGLRDREIDGPQRDCGINPQPLRGSVLDPYGTKDVFSRTTSEMVPTFVPIQTVGMTVNSEHVVGVSVAAFAHEEPVPVAESRVIPYPLADPMPPMGPCMTSGCLAGCWPAIPVVFQKDIVVELVSVLRCPVASVGERASDKVAFSLGIVGGHGFDEKYEQ